MSLSCPCTCGCGCGENQGCRLVVVLPDNPVEGYAIQNVNLVGFGVADSENPAGVFNFRGIASANSSLLVTYDADKHTIFLTLDVDSIIDDLPDASTTQRGVLETATDAEAIAKVLTNKIIVPSNFAAMDASQTFKGFIEIATNAEAIAGASTTLAITPASLAAVIATFGTTVTFADSVARAAAIPDFEGQIGFQLDSDVIWAGTGVAVGDFNVAALMLSSSANVAVADTQIDLDGNAFTITAGDFTFGGGGTFTFGTGIIDILPNAVIRDDSVTVPANSVLATSAVAGQFSSKPINQFLSNSNTNAGWTAFTNSAVRKTGDCNTITLPELAQVVDTLIQTLGTSLQTPIP